MVFRRILDVVGVVGLLLSMHARAFANEIEYPEYPAYQASWKLKASVRAKRIERIRRGEMLAKAGDCIACHTRQGEQPFAGGAGLETPFGTFYAPNITGDKTFGIGGWTEKAFIRAMREGRRPDGKHYFPVFPYLYFNRVTDQDLADIFVYLKAIPSSQKPNRVHNVPFPFNWRFTQFFWKFLYFDNKGPYRFDKKQSTTWNRGAYLAQGLGHCSMCHTPINFLGAPQKDLGFTGSDASGYFAPNITGSNLKRVSVDEVVRIFTHDTMPGGGRKVMGPMKEVNHDSLRYMDRSDLRAIAIYLKSLKDPEANNPERHSGHMVYKKNCGGCHTSGAGGAYKFGDHRAWGERLQQGRDVLYQHSIKGFKMMPAKGNCLSCTDEDVKRAVDYILKYSVRAEDGRYKKRMGEKIKRLTLADGRRIYRQNCSVCHDRGIAGAQKLTDKKAWQNLAKKGVDVLYLNVMKGKGAMSKRAGCKGCSDAELLAALKYMLEKADLAKDHHLW
jgi:cytochrome c5